MPKKSKKRNSVSQSLECQPPKRQRKNSATESSARFNDMDVDCIEHIFSFLTIKDKLNFSKVCSTWKAMFKQFWRIDDLNVILNATKRSAKEEKMKVADFKKLLEIGGRHIKSFNINANYEERCLRGRINAQEYVIIGKFNVCDFLKVIANISTKVQNFICKIRGFDISSLATISKLISRNREMKCLKMDIMHPLSKYLKLKDLPESIEDFEVNCFVEDASTLCDWLSVAKNLRSLSVNRCDEFASPNIKVLQRIAVLKNLEELRMTFPDRDVQIDDFLSAISSGCKNLKKLDLNSCTFTCKGLNPILSELHLTHLDLKCCCPELNSLVPQTTLKSLRMIDLQIDSSSLTQLLRAFQELQFIEVDDVDMTDKHVYGLCAACPRLEHVQLTPFRSEITDQAILHLLTNLPNLKSANVNVLPTNIGRGKSCTFTYSLR